MEDSVSTTELDKALTELDGMYNDLSATLKRQKKADAESAENAAVNTSSTSANPGSDDYDYDIPRPAGGRDNNATSIGFNSPEKNSITFRGEIYATSMKVRRPTSPSLSVNSDSSGCGTLPSHSIVHPNEIAFPAPPAFDPPPPASMKPIFIPANDSDYDEVASSDEETPNLTSMEEPPTSFKNYAYTDVILEKNVIPDESIYCDVPDYDEVGDGEETIRSSRDLHENNNIASPFQETRGMLPRPENDVRDSYATPVVIEMRQIQVEVHQQQSDEVVEHTFNNLTLEKQNNNDKNDVSHVPIGTFPVSDSSYSLAKLKEGDEEGGQNITTMQSNGHTSGTSTMRSHRKNEKDKKRKKDCSCAATLPIMSAVIVIVIAIFIVVTVGYVYLGIKNEEVLAERRLTKAP